VEIQIIFIYRTHVHMYNAYTQTEHLENIIHSSVTW